MVEIRTLVEGNVPRKLAGSKNLMRRGKEEKTGEAVQRWNPLAAGIWLPATVARILDASPARGHEAKPVP